MNLSQEIRDWLASQTSPRTSRHVAEAIGRKPQKVAQTLHKLAEAGMVTSDDSYPRLYAFARDAVSLTTRIAMANAARGLQARPVDPELRKKRNNEANRAYYLRHRDTLLAKKRLRVRSSTPRVLLTPEQREANRLAYEAKRKTNRTLARQQKALAVVARHIETLPPAPNVETIRTETYAEFIARGGYIERLGCGDVSEANRFKRIGRQA